MDNEFIISLCAGFGTAQVFYWFRWWRSGGGGEKLLRYSAYAFFVGLMNYLSLFMITKLYDIHFLVQILIALLGCFYMLKSDWYFHFIKGMPAPKSNKFFIGGLFKDPESVQIDSEGNEIETKERPER